MKKIFAVLSLLAIVGVAFSQTAPTPPQFQMVSDLVGKPGVMATDGTYKINVARSDVKFVSSTGMPIPTDMGLSSYVVLNGTAQQMLAGGDIALLAPEIDAVIDTLRAGKFEVVSLHNHMSTEEPRLFFLHFQFVGDADSIGKTFKKVISILGTIKAAPPVIAGTKPTLDASALEQILGVKGAVLPSGTIKYSKPRNDLKITLDDMSFTSGMGVGSWAAFNACECGQTMVMGDTCCLRGELQKAVDAYRAAGIHITGIHAHFIGASQEVIFMHYEGEGDAQKLARGIRACWDQLVMKMVPARPR